MIASLSGTVEHVALDRAVIAVGGLGVQFSATPQTLATLHEGRPGAVQTHLVVKEDALTLYGFADRDEREVFEVLITANGVGPRLALAILSVHHPETVRRAVTEEDEKTLTRVPGIGPKMARKIIVELSGRLAPTGEPVPEEEAQEPLDEASSAEEQIAGDLGEERGRSRARQAAMAMTMIFNFEAGRIRTKLSKS